MAERARMTAAQLADELLADEHADVLRESVAWMARELMEAEVAGKVGAELGERTPERVAQRNGDRPRPWDTRAGSIELAIPKLRTGSYFPSFLEPRRRAEQALVAVVGGGLRQRRVDPQGRPAGRADGPAPPGQGPGIAALPRPGRAGPGLPRAALGGRLPVPSRGGVRGFVTAHGAAQWSCCPVAPERGAGGTSRYLQLRGRELQRLAYWAAVNRSLRLHPSHHLSSYPGGLGVWSPQSTRQPFRHSPSFASAGRTGYLTHSPVIGSRQGP
jgi:Transposase, Mutator family